MLTDFPVCDNQVQFEKSQVEIVRSEGKKHRDFESYITPLMIIESRIKIRFHNSERRAKVLSALKFIQFEVAKLLDIEELAHKRISPTECLADSAEDVGIYLVFKEKENL